MELQGVAGRRILSARTSRSRRSGGRRDEMGRFIGPRDWEADHLKRKTFRDEVFRSTTSVSGLCCEVDGHEEDIEEKPFIRCRFVTRHLRGVAKDKGTWKRQHHRALRILRCRMRRACYDLQGTDVRFEQYYRMGHCLSLDSGLRVEGIPSLDLRDLIIEVLHPSARWNSLRAVGQAHGYLKHVQFWKRSLHISKRQRML